MFIFDNTVNNHNVKSNDNIFLRRWTIFGHHWQPFQWDGVFDMFHNYQPLGG